MRVLKPLSHCEEVENDPFQNLAEYRHKEISS